MKFKVRDKDHTLGVASIPIHNLVRQRDVSKRWLTLVPHKKSHEAHGELLVECFVSETRPAITRSENPSLSNSQEDIHASFKGSGIVRGVKDRFSLHRRNPSWTRSAGSSTPSSPSPKRLSGSDLELHSRPIKTYTSEGSVRGGMSPDESGSLRSSEAENLLTPEVSGISPREGVVGGGQRVVLRGSCLGECRGDVVRVVIADMDCTETLEYFSQCKCSKHVRLAAVVRELFANLSMHPPCSPTHTLANETDTPTCLCSVYSSSGANQPALVIRGCR